MTKFYIAVTAGVGEEDAEAFGPFSTGAAAEKFAAEYDEEPVRPAYSLMVLELIPVREGQRAIREERERYGTW